MQSFYEEVVGGARRTKPPFTFSNTRGTVEAGGMAGSAKLAVTGPEDALAIRLNAALSNLAGAAAELLHLPDHGVTGNGHGLIFEKNSDEALQPVLDWLAKVMAAKQGA